MGRVVVAVCLLVLGLPTAAQELPASFSGTDPRGDVRLVGPSGQDVGPAAGFDHGDVLSARVEKDSSETLLFALGVADPATLWQTSDADLHPRAALHFVFGEVHYFIDFGRRDEATLNRYVSEDRHDFVDGFPATIEGGEVVSSIAGAAISDLAGATLRHPAQLTEIWGQSRMLVVNPPGLWAVDLAPDQGAWGGLRTPVDPGAGPLLVTPRQAFRGSNGGAGVLAFELVVDNIAADTLVALAEVAGLPSGWSGLVPARLVLAPGETRIVPVLVTIPFAHDHGTTKDFQVHFEVPERQVVEQTLQVVFFEVPQPAGHHPTVYFHSATVPGNSEVGWFDTLQQHDEDEQVPVSNWGRATDPATGGSTDFFHMDLSPDLGIGLDFDLGRMATATFALQSRLPEHVVVRARLEHCNPSDLSGRDYGEYYGDLRCGGTWLPLLEAESEVDLPAGGLPMSMDLQPTAYADLVHPQRGAILSFALEIVKEPAGLANSIQFLPDNGRIDLPLFEYQPPLTGDFALLGDIGFESLPVERSVGPGSQLWQEFRLTNAGTRAHDIDVEAIGHNAAWVRLDPSTFTLAAGETRAILAHVTVPPDAGATEFAHVYIVASALGEEELVTAVPMRVDAAGPVTEDPWPEGLESVEKGSPGATLPLLLLGLASALGFLRRFRPA